MIKTELKGMYKLGTGKPRRVPFSVRKKEEFAVKGIATKLNLNKEKVDKILELSEIKKASDNKAVKKLDTNEILAKGFIIEKNGETHIFGTRQEMADFLNVGIRYVYGRMRREQEIRGWKITKFVNEDAPQTRPAIRTVTLSKEGAEIVFKTHREACEFLDCDQNLTKQMFKKNGKVNGWSVDVEYY